MCGIWARLGCSNDPETPEVWLKQLEARGPEGTKLIHVTEKVSFGFTRLAINGLNPLGMQPFKKNDITWMCNGEIYNYKDIESKLNILNSESGSDCHCIGDLYMKYRDDLTTFARMLDGVFALTLYDNERNLLVVTRDPYGIRPLFIGTREVFTPVKSSIESIHGQLFISTNETTVFASEIKALTPHFTNVKPFPPGHLHVYDAKTQVLMNDITYHTIPWIVNPQFTPSQPSALQSAAESIRLALETAVEKRMLTERPVAALLSGGLDSSLIAALVQRSLQQQNKPALKTFSIGFEGSSDLANARIVADWIKSDHHEIIMTPDEFFKAIPEVIKAIESFDTTTVRASVGNYLIGKKIREMSECKVVFNGDGSDELFGGYLYFNNAPSDEAFSSEIARLLGDIHTFDVLRSDRCISSNGLEARTPFLDKQFVAVVRSIHPSFLRPIKGQQVEKYILRYAFDDGVTLPESVLWRRKEAFSDGVSSPDIPWFQEIQNRLVNILEANWKDLASLSFSQYMLPRTTEEYYYRYIFTSFYGLGAMKATVPYRWMPKWCPETNDPSAKTLGIY